MTNIDTLWEESFKNHKYIDPKDLANLKTENFNILSINIRSLSRNGDKLKDMLYKVKHLDLICIQESWSPRSPIELNDFRIEITKRLNKSGGGLACYIKNHIAYNLIETKITDHIEYQLVKLSTKNDSLIIINTYIPKKIYGAAALEELSKLCTSIKTRNIVILGDLNLNMLCNKDRSMLDQFAVDNHLSLLCNLPTRITNKSHSCLDLAVTKLKVNCTCEVVQADISDHFPILLQIEANKTVHKKLKEALLVRNLNQTTLDKMKCDLASIKWEEFEGLSHNNSVDKFLSIIKMSLDKHAALKTFSKPKNKLNGWFTKGLEISRRNKLKLLKRWLREKNNTSCNKDNLDITYQYYKRYRNLYYQVIERAKILHTQHLLKSSSFKDKWKISNDLLGRNTSDKELPEQFIISEESGRTLYTKSKLEAANQFNKFFY